MEGSFTLTPPRNFVGLVISYKVCLEAKRLGIETLNLPVIHQVGKEERKQGMM